MSDHTSLPGPGGETLRAGDITIHLLGRDAPARFAASELVRYLPRLLPGRALDVYVGPPDRALAASGLYRANSPGEQGILVQGGGHRYAVAGGSSAATLHASYALLEALGARWLKPGPAGELIRPLDGPLPLLSLHSEPAFLQRGLADGCLSWWPGTAPFRDWLEEMRAMVDWMGKMRMNRLFIHFNRLPPGDISPLLPELEQRGIALELGGHNLPKLLPAGSRELEPELCRLWNGVRRPDGNFCTASPRTVQLLEEGARHYVERLPAADIYHLWPYDANQDPWCSCPDCRGRSDGEQMWQAVLAAAKGVAMARPGATVSGLLYHESLGASDSRPDPLHSSFAPRERCYLHPIDDGACRRNRGYLRHLQMALGRYQEVFDGSGDTPDPARRGSRPSWTSPGPSATSLDRRAEGLTVLEYYGDPILLGRPANRPAVVASDLEAYRSAGVRSISTLVFGALSWWLYPVQLYAYARGCWNPAQAVAAMDDYCLSLAGESGGELLARYYRLAGEAAGTHLRFCGYGLDGSWATLPFPPISHPDEAHAHLAEMLRGETLLREAGQMLERVAGPPANLEDLLASQRAAHRLEEAFHRAVARQMERQLGSVGDDVPYQGIQGEPTDPREAFASAVRAMEQAPPSVRGIFGTHWMLPWLRRAGED